MKRAAVVAWTKHGQTEKIARRLQFELLRRGIATQVVMLETQRDVEAFDPAGYGGVLIGAPVYASKYPEPVLQWTRRHAATLNRVWTGFFSVGLNAANPSSEAVEAELKLRRGFCEATGLEPDVQASIAGALNYTRYNWFLRRMMRRISAEAGGPTDMTRDHEMTDWNQVIRFALEFSRTDDATGIFAAQA